MDRFTGEPMSVAPEDDGSVLWPSYFLNIFSSFVVRRGSYDRSVLVSIMTTGLILEL